VDTVRPQSHRVHTGQIGWWWSLRTVNMGVISRLTRQRGLFETSYSITGKVRPPPADPQVSSLAQDCQN
jgi:hypothetical protein